MRTERHTFVVDIVVSRFIVLGLSFALIRESSEQNLNAITPEAIRVRTGAVGYARFNIFRRNGRFESDIH